MPTLRILNPEEKNRFLYEGDLNNLSGDDIAKFIADFKAGNLMKHILSEPIPENATVDGVTTVVNYNWQDVVMDDSKDVLVEIYAPWCGHCKKLAPIWDELGKNVEQIDDLIIAKMDGTANEVSGLSIKGYPTVLFYPKGNKKAVLDYKSGRDSIGPFLKWLNENSEVYKAAGAAKKAEVEAKKAQE